jgi:hypothetical protein
MIFGLLQAMSRLSHRAMYIRMEYQIRSCYPFGLREDYHGTSPYFSNKKGSLFCSIPFSSFVNKMYNEGNWKDVDDTYHSYNPRNRKEIIKIITTYTSAKCSSKSFFRSISQKTKQSKISESNAKE